MFKKDLNLNPFHLNPGIHGSANDLRLRSPSYSGDNSSKFLKSEQIQHKRKISIEKTPSEQYTSPFIVKPNIPTGPYEKSPSQGYSNNYPQTHKPHL